MWTKKQRAGTSEYKEINIILFVPYMRFSSIYLVEIFASSRRSCFISYITGKMSRVKTSSKQNCEVKYIEGTIWEYHPSSL